MAELRIYHVRYRDDAWVVEAEGAKQPSASEARKADAVKRAREIAENQQPSQLIVHKQDGTVQNETSYGDVEEAPSAEADEAPATHERGVAGDAGYALAALANDALSLATEAVKLARTLPERAQERAQDMRDLRSRREQLEDRIRELREAAEQRFDEKSAQGRTVAEDILGDQRVQRVIDQAKTARSQVKAAITSIRKTGTETAAGAVRGGRDQAAKARSQVKGAATSVRKTGETAADAADDATGDS